MNGLKARGNICCILNAQFRCNLDIQAESERMGKYPMKMLTKGEQTVFISGKTDFRPKLS